MSARHRCLIYEGSPSPHLETIAASIKRHLDKNYRCLYMNSEAMIAELRSYLVANGVDVDKELNKASLVLTSEQEHLARDGLFDIEQMLRHLEQTLDRAMRDNFAGLFATGDMAWEFGPKRDFSRLLEYEWRLETFFHEHPQLTALCQYHIDTLPQEALRTGAITHEMIFVNETLSVPNPNYVRAESRGTRILNL